MPGAGERSDDDATGASDLRDASQQEGIRSRAQNLDIDPSAVEAKCPLFGKGL
ncbi:hypothetical protein [Nocardioides sp. B-3]|uniref:hypothetical protein n=1 Tax=Nocardioides sp. B-3 TaxID=2895565 RepID=UPI002152B4A5|nr:hypothetical protein [Nocardioides sp. B-3]UUZ59473.1 hypothetical protein LP418_27455 [Nocardioides sp. B-3]